MEALGVLGTVDVVPVEEKEALGDCDCLGVLLILAANFFLICPKRVDATLEFLKPDSWATRFQSTCELELGQAGVFG